jgi:3,4-dihydroxy-2-butanone 4-phosphate synthase
MNRWSSRPRSGESGEDLRVTVEARSGVTTAISAADRAHTLHHALA